MAKVLVMDKCCFQGIGKSRLVEFVGKYRVVLPHILAIECVTSDDCTGKRPAKNAIKLLHRVEALVKAGAYLGRSSLSMYKEETKSRCAAVQIVDKEATHASRAATLALTEDSVRREDEKCRREFDPLISYVNRLGQVFVEAIREKDLSKAFQEEIREEDKVERFGKYLKQADEERDDILQNWMQSLASDVTEEWYIWQFIRLWFGWAVDWAARRADADDAALQADISNDYYDMEYVASLSRADGLLTLDTKLVEPLARAAFPEKDVYSSLEEVPDSYRCDWAGP